MTTARVTFARWSRIYGLSAGCLAGCLAGCDYLAKPPTHPPTRAASGRVSPSDEDPSAVAESAAKPPGAQRPAPHFLDDFDEAAQAARSQQRPMMLLFTARWCRFCEKLQAEALADPAIVELSGRFICVTVDADTQAEICGQFDIDVFPTVQFLSPGGVPLNQVRGQKSTAEFEVAMNSALRAANTRAALERRLR